MAVIICMLRGVNVGGHNRIKMEDLRALCESLKLRNAQTYVQSGNVLFHADEKDVTKLRQRIADAIEKKCGFRCDVITRTTAELRTAIARNPFAKRRGIEPNKLLVTFLAGDPSDEAREKLRALDSAPEEVRIDGQEIYIYYPNGMARPTLPAAKIERILKVSGTGRNWNSVTKMLEIAEEMESGK
jgi:uncharacterized protein (DUF1697 family)